MYSVYQHWDPLKVCMVGQSYPPEFYNFITNTRVRAVMERIAQETEEDYQKLIKLLQSFGVEVLRPSFKSIDYRDYVYKHNTIQRPPMTPRDYSAMIGSTFYVDDDNFSREYIERNKWQEWRGSDWPLDPPSDKNEFDKLPEFIKDEILKYKPDINIVIESPWTTVIEKIKSTNNVILNKGINSATVSRIGNDLYFGTESYGLDLIKLKNKYSSMFLDYRCHIVDTGGHSDGTYCPVKPGLIVSLNDVPTYAETYPEWEVVYLPGQSWTQVKDFLKLKEKNAGKWWVPGEELNNEFTEFVESWLTHWVGYVEETVFDVNMLVIDEHNVICNNYNKKVFDAFERHRVTPHVVNFRHRYFWDGGLHCITSDVHREGTIKDYFPERR